MFATNRYKPPLAAMLVIVDMVAIMTNIIIMFNELAAMRPVGHTVFHFDDRTFHTELFGTGVPLALPATLFFLLHFFSVVLEYWCAPSKPDSKQESLISLNKEDPPCGEPRAVKARTAVNIAVCTTFLFFGLLSVGVYDISWFTTLTVVAIVSILRAYTSWTLQEHVDFLAGCFPMAVLLPVTFSRVDGHDDTLYTLHIMLFVAMGIAQLLIHMAAIRQEKIDKRPPAEDQLLGFDGLPVRFHYRLYHGATMVAVVCVLQLYQLIDVA